MNPVGKRDNLEKKTLQKEGKERDDLGESKEVKVC
jgi:hypothetical protein